MLSTPSETGQHRWRVTEIDLRVARQLRKLRTHRGIHPQLLDSAIGAPSGTVWRYEEGERPISAVNLYRLSKLLDTPMEAFFRDTETEAADNRSAAAERPSPPTSAPSPAEAQRFLALYDKIDDPEIKRNVREMLRSLAEGED